ncbi:hypothetical protein [Streptomyces sp. KR80]|uniref:hypothetical protein n=1 Tax=Streptomyces sp. KR80 TaxID=3457426 RepID=UPI003FD6AAD7
MGHITGRLPSGDGGSTRAQRRGRDSAALPVTAGGSRVPTRDELPVAAESEVVKGLGPFGRGREVMTNVTLTTFLSLDGGMRPLGPNEDPSGGFEQGGWLVLFVGG